MLFSPFFCFASSFHFCAVSLVRSPHLPRSPQPQCMIALWGDLYISGAGEWNPLRGGLESRWHLLVWPRATARRFLLTPIIQYTVQDLGSRGLLCWLVLVVFAPLPLTSVFFDLFARFFCHTTMGTLIQGADSPYHSVYLISISPFTIDITRSFICPPVSSVTAPISGVAGSIRVCHTRAASWGIPGSYRPISSALLLPQGWAKLWWPFPTLAFRIPDQTHFWLVGLFCFII